MTSVEAFDRGVEALLVEHREASTIQRVDLLRNLRGLRHKLGFATSGPFTPLKSTRSLPVGQTATLAIRDVLGEEKLLLATIYQVDDESLLLRLADIDPTTLMNMKEVLSSTGREVDVHFFRSDDCAYSFRGRILEFRQREAAFVRIDHPSRLYRQQRRNFLRINMQEPISFRWFSRSF